MKNIGFFLASRIGTFIAGAAMVVGNLSPEQNAQLEAGLTAIALVVCDLILDRMRKA